MSAEKRDDFAAYLFHQGTNFSAYEYLGVHRTQSDDGVKLIFRVWAPNAAAVSVTGDFDMWRGENPMSRVTDAGVWEAVLPDMPDGTRYKYLITASDGMRLYKADPYAFACELPPETASVVCDMPTDYKWHDAGWMAARPNAREYDLPMNIYELHLGSWMRHPDGTVMSYGELARELAPYVKRMGYTHIELLPVMEHPFDGSWGYQVTGYYAPTARHGSPSDFCAFVDSMHEAGIGVILDWVPAHFPKDAHGLYEFDGVPLYEYQGADRMEHAGWGTRRFDVGRNEVESFLISNAHFWAEVYHADGLRVDAVASMLYLDYDRKPGEWIPNVYGDNRCLEAMAFFRKLNGSMAHDYPGVMMIAEESSAWADITTFDRDGLGFTYKWNMGWMNDVLSYTSMDPIFRKYHHEKITFSMMYAFSEKYMLPISHDEVVHGKKSLLDRCPGDYGQKFAGTRAFMTYMMTHPGKKLLFMSSEIGQFREWDYAGSVEWFLLDYEMHAKLQNFVADLNHLYLASPELWQRDTSWDGFKWVDADNRDGSVISYLRIAGDGSRVLVVINFTPVYFPEFRVGVPVRGVWRELISSDDMKYGGGGVTHGELHTDHVEAHGYNNSLNLRIPPLGGLIFRLEKAEPEPAKVHQTAAVNNATADTKKADITGEKTKNCAAGRRKRSSAQTKE
ncbi:MAG: 1,4-alpha-glucan branching protein GlgB [Clostridia bacterium]|nr:1,4-alpha-glucan branching protein GlgB [Clostridia bacterium]